MPKLCRVDPERREEYLQKVKQFAQELKTKFPIQEIYLHGSFASGKIHEGSDMDLVIVGDFKERFLDRIGRILDLTDLPIEPLVYTPEEFDKMRQAANPFIATVLATGQRL